MVERVPTDIEDKIAALAEVKREIRLAEPNLSSQKVEARAIKAVGLDEGISAAEADKRLNAPRLKRTRSAASTVGGKVVANTNKAQRIVFGVMISVTLLTIAGDIISGRAKATDAIPRRMIAGTIAGVMLMVLAIPLPRIASSLAVVIAVAALFVNPDGAKIITAISRIGGGDPQAPSGGGGGSTQQPTPI